MSGEGTPALETLDCRGLRVGVVAACWHPPVMDRLLAGATRALAEARVEDPTVVRVPGSFELPVAALHLARHGFHAVVALGVVIRGGTPHFEHVCRVATDGLGRVALDSGVPVGFGLLTCDTEQQALDRAGPPPAPDGDDAAPGKGYEAVHAALSTALAIRALAPHDRT